MYKLYSRLNRFVLYVELNRMLTCSEGAGYAGGIVSSAIDGERSAEAMGVFVALRISKKEGGRIEGKMEFILLMIYGS